MIKKIKVSQLRTGMYIADLNCNWIRHPFAANKFLLKSEVDIRKIIAAGIKEIDIDISKGADEYVESVKPTPAPVKKVEEPTEAPEEKRITVAEEQQYAKVAFAEAGLLINDMMTNVKMGRNIEMELVDPVINQMSESILRNENALLGLSRIRIMDQYTFEHSVSFGILLMAFAKNMGMDKETIQALGAGGLLHDIGKTLTPDEILNKPGKLTDAEFVIMRRHVVDSAKILNKTKNLSQISIDVGALHHERYDGTGYPDGLKGDEISLYGQMAAIVDVYDALTANRCYHEGKDPSVVLQLLVKWGGTHFNPKLVQKFIQSVGIYPAGSLVMLNNKHLAKVIEVHDNLLKPTVEVFLNTRERSYITPVIVVLSTSKKLSIVSAESYEKWNIQL